MYMPCNCHWFHSNWFSFHAINASLLFIKHYNRAKQVYHLQTTYTWLLPSTFNRLLKMTQSRLYSRRKVTTHCWKSPRPWVWTANTKLTSVNLTWKKWLYSDRLCQWHLCILFIFFRIHVLICVKCVYK